MRLPFVRNPLIYCFSEIPDSHRSICSYAWSAEGSKNAIRALPFQSTTYDTHKNRVGKGNQFRDRGYQKNVHDGEATFVSIALVGRWRRTFDMEKPKGQVWKALSPGSIREMGRGEKCLSCDCLSVSELCNRAEFAQNVHLTSKVRTVIIQQAFPLHFYQIKHYSSVPLLCCKSSLRFVCIYSYENKFVSYFFATNKGKPRCGETKSSPRDDFGWDGKPPMQRAPTLTQRGGIVSGNLKEKKGGHSWFLS